MKNLSDNMIGIMTDPCPDLLTGLFGIIKSGNGFVPIDPTQPNERLGFIFDDCQIAILLTQDKHLAKAIEISERSACLQKIVCLDKITQPVPDSVAIYDCENYLLDGPIEEKNEIKPEQPVYVIYTSGTTGVPKGVPISHQNLLPLLDWSREYFKFDEQTTVLQNLNYAFDFGVFELLTTLLFGGTLHIRDKDAQLDASSFVNYVNEHGINTIHSTPSFFLHITSSGKKLESLKILHLGGEALTQDIVNSLFAQVNDECLVYNGYGPTEATINCAIFALGNKEVWNLMNRENIPIGKPSANNRLYILDKNGQPTPVGVSGELHVSGVALTRGYINRPDLTKKKFINNPFSEEPHSRLYKTGDLARYLPDGNIEYLGRIDNQVKIRGFRIELGEIEAVLATHPFVKENAVIVHEASQTDKRLVAYLVVFQGQVIENTTLRRFLTERLPDYMIPSAFVTLDSLPLTPNGKIDRRALSQLSASHEISEKTFVAPRTSEEELLANLWGELLDVKQVGIHDNFFELGGHSLLATQVISKLRNSFGVELPLRDLFESPTIAELAQLIEMNREREPNDQLAQTIQPISRQQKLPLSYFQEQLWFLVQVNPDIPFYNESTAIHIKGELNVAALSQSFNAIIKRHEILRTTFTIVDGEPVQNVIALPPTFKLPIVDLRKVPDEKREAAALRLANEHAKQLFDLTQAPLVRAILVQMDETQFRLFATAHHIIADGFCLYNIFMQELISFYKVFSTGESLRLPELPIQYADFAGWQRQQTFEDELSYWKTVLGNNPPMLQLPTDHSRPVKPTFRGAKQKLTLSQNLTTKLKQLDQQEGVTLFMTLLATFNTLLYRYTGQDDMIIGSVADCHNRSELENVMGYFVNTLVLRTDMSGNPTFKQLLARVREVTLGAYSHHDLPFQKLVEVFNPARNSNQNPFFEVALTLEPPVMSALDSDWKLYQYDDGIDTDTARFDLSLSFEERTNEIIGRIEYSTDLFEAATIERMIGHFQTLLEGIVTNPQQRISELPLLTERERHQLLVEWNDTQTDYPKDKCVHQLFEDQVETTPSAVAVVFGDQQLSYRELNTKANQLAHYLQTLGVKPEVLVGICVERSIEMVVGLLGILKAGGAYLPLDPAYPTARLAFMLEDAQVQVLLTQSSLKEGLPETQTQVVCLDVEAEMLSQYRSENLISGITPTNLAYVIYTSGSTGNPKGVAIGHSNVVALLDWSKTIFTLEQISGTLLSTSLNFDVSVFELFVPLSRGGKIILVENILSLSTLSEKAGVIMVNTVPSAMKELIKINGVPASVRVINLAGEPFSPQLVQELYRIKTIQQVFNIYGPTEDTVYATFTLLSQSPHEKLTIGRPITNAQTYILDHNLEQVPIGVSGELHLGGVGLARGYLNRPKLTAEKFIKNPFSDDPKSRLYKTGDLARYLPDGNIEYLGRIDNQVKVRGFRIELGEIEAVLAQHPDVQENAVIVHEASKTDKRLVAYIVPHQGQMIENTTLRDFLSAQLPDYMVPSAFVTLENLPLTPNGKIDRRALSQLSVISYQLSEKTFVAPQTQDEKLLAEIWASVLGIERVGVHDNFFDLGGHSLLAVSLLAQIEQQFGKHLPLATLFQGATIEELARLLNPSKDTTNPWAPLVAIQANGSKQPFFCIPGAGGNVLYYHELARNLGEDQPFYGLQAVGLDGETAPDTRVEDMAARYIKEIQTVQKQGPYLLGGHSFGAWITLEISKQLQLSGEKVARLAIFDTTVPFNQAIGIDWDDAHWITDIAHIIGSLLGKKLKVSYAEFQQLETQAQFNYLHEILEQNNWLISLKQLQALVKIFKANCQTNYVPQDMPTIPISLFKAHDIPLMSQTSAQMETFSQHLKQEASWGWHQYVEGSVDTHIVPGDHHTMMSLPNVQVLAEKLRVCLEQGLKI